MSGRKILKFTHCVNITVWKSKNFLSHVLILEERRRSRPISVKRAFSDGKSKKKGQKIEKNHTEVETKFNFEKNFNVYQPVFTLL